MLRVQVILQLSSSGNEKLAGRIGIRLFQDAPSGATRFAALARDRQGVGYVRSQIDGIAKGFISSSGVTSLNYSSQDSTAFEQLEQLEVKLRVVMLQQLLLPL